MKVLQIIGALSKGGAEKQCCLLANHLPQGRYKVGIAYLNEGPDPILLPHVARLPISRGSWIAVPSLWWRVDCAVDAFGPDIVHVWLPEIVSVPGAWAARRRRIPVVSGHRGSMRFSMFRMKGLRDRLRYMQYLWADRIISNFDVAGEPRWFRRLYARKGGSVIANGVDIEKLRAVPAAHLPLRAEHRFIFVGRLVPEKGLTVVLDAVARLASTGVDVSLTIFGEGPDRYVSMLHDFASNRGISKRVAFEGHCRHWIAFAEDAEALLLPSYAEGTSNVVLEAMAVGLPVIVSDLAMAREMLTDGVNAIIVAAWEGAAWGDAMKRIIDDRELRCRMVIEGRKVATRYTVKAMIEGYERVYEDLFARAVMLR